MIWGVGVNDGLRVGCNAIVSVGEASTVSSASGDVACSRVALGTTVMRGTGEPRGMGVAEDIGVGLTSSVGKGGLVGVGCLREQATNAKRKSKDQAYRFMVSSVRIQF